MKSRYHFIINPKSGSSVDIGTIVRLREHLSRQDHDIQFSLTKSLAHAGHLAARAIDSGADFIVVAGGDGTVRAVAEAMAGSEIPILILPRGTENLLSQELGIDGSVHNAVKILKEGMVRNLDLGLVNDRYFMAIVGVGFDATVIERINQFRSGHITHGDYIWPICRTFWEYKFPHLQIEADGKTVCDEPALVFIGNISRYAISLPIVPHADCSDGKLDVCIYRCRRRRELLLHAIRTIAHQAERSANVSRFNCTNLTISSREPNVPVQIDGDPGPSLPLKITIIPAAARVLTPPAHGGQQYCRPVRFYHLRRWLFG
ncbi:diacylglycerol/lipid kinase family protein [Planctomycetota bacterium]